MHASVLAHDRTQSSIDSQADGHIIRMRAYGELMFVPVSPQWPRALNRAIAVCRPDLLHLHTPNPWAFMALGSAAARRLPWIIHWHADIPLDFPSWRMRAAYRPYAWFERKLLQRATRVIASSHTYAEASHALAPFRDKTEVIPLGLSQAPSAGEAPGWPSQRGLKLLAVGRLSYYKGFETLLDALAKVADVQLLLIGDGERRAALQERIYRWGLQDRVRLAGHLSDAAIEAAYRACDVFCLPSIDRAEAFGLVLLEAMRAGKPVIASRVRGSGMCEVVADGVTGSLVTPGDSQALAAAIVELRDRPEQRLAFGAAGRARFAQCYQIEPVTTQIAQLYRRVLAGD